MNDIAKRAAALIQPLRAIGIGQPEEERETLRQLLLLAGDVRATGQDDLIRFVDEAVRAAPGHQDEPLSALVETLTR